MGVDAHFIHRCDVERFTSIGRDGLKAEQKSWQVWEQGMRCRFVEKEQRVADSALAERPTITTYLLLFGVGRDVKPKDRIVNIVLEDGTTDAGPYTIEHVLRRRGRAAKHQSARLEKGTTR
jgi:hypothetical protein